MVEKNKKTQTVMVRLIYRKSRLAHVSGVDARLYTCNSNSRVKEKWIREKMEEEQRVCWRGNEADFLIKWPFGLYINIYIYVCVARSA